jgi:glutamyl-tRNA reductase
VGVLFKTRGIGELMRRLDEHGRAVSEGIVGRTLVKERLAGLPEPAKEDIREMARKIVSKMLAGPKNALQAAARNGRWDEYARMAEELLGLSEKKDDEQNPPPRP